jgi:hypothetical protein
MKEKRKGKIKLKRGKRNIKWAQLQAESVREE